MRSLLAAILDEVKTRLKSTANDAIAGNGLTTEEVISATEKWQ